MKKPIRTVTIEVYGLNDYDIRHDGLVVDRLTWDEMLGSVAEILHPKIGVSRYSARPEKEPSEHPREVQGD